MSRAPCESVARRGCNAWTTAARLDHASETDACGVAAAPFAGRSRRSAGASRRSAIRRAAEPREPRPGRAGTSAALARGMATDRPIFVYDGDCGFCSWVVDRLARSPRGDRIDWMMSQALDAPPADLTSSDLDRAAWYVARGRAHGGFAAFRRLSLVLPALWPLAPIFWFPGVGVLGALVYRGIAARRRAISLRLGLAACRLPAARRLDATTTADPERTS
jgi:predicted DCC family thiol-disulfide oxidoreductase YuxK